MAKQLIERENNVLTMQRCFVCGRSIPEHTSRMFRGYKDYRKWVSGNMDDIKRQRWLQGAHRRKMTFKQYILEIALLTCQHKRECINCHQHFDRAKLAWVDAAVQKYQEQTYSDNF